MVDLLQFDFWEQDRTRIHEKRKNRFRNLNPWQKICMVLLFVFVVAWSFYVGFSYAGASQPEWNGYMVTGESTNIDAIDTMSIQGIKVVLVIGCDARPTVDDVGRTDTIMVVFFDSNANEIRLLSIPRDTYVTLPTSGGKTKINHSYSFGGVSLLEETIEQNIGIEIDNYMEVDFNGFKELVDIMGGVDLDVEDRMLNKNEGIDLQPGLQTLDGANALAYVRYREPLYADIGRIDRQQKFISAMLNQAFDISNVWHIPKMINTGMKYISTDLSIKEMLALAGMMQDTDLSAMEMSKLEGDGQYINGVSYWVPDEEKMKLVVDYLMGETNIEDTSAEGQTDPDSSPQSGSGSQ